MRSCVLGAALAAVLALSCDTTLQYGAGREGILAGKIVVKDAGTGEALVGAFVNVKEGFGKYIAGERTDDAGEMMFAKRYEAASVSDTVWPPHLILEVTKDGYQGVKMSVNSEKFLFEHGDKEMYKEFVVELAAGKGMKRVEGYKPDPYSGH